MRLARLVTAACGIVVLTLAGCSSKPPPGQAPPTSSLVTEPSSSVPAITSPLNANNLQSDPCGGLSSAQLASYMGQIRKVERNDLENGPGCNWYPEDGNQADVSLNFFSKLVGVNGLYASGSLFPYFERAGLVGGYPAVHEAQGAKGPQAGECETIVAVSDHGIFGIYVTASQSSYAYYKDMCAASDALAVAAIENLKKVGG